MRYLILAVSLATFASDSFAAVCSPQTMKQVDDVNRKVMMRGAYALIDTIQCDGAGKVSLFTIRRIQDGKIERWRPEDGPVDLLRKYVGEMPK
jgi:hypothetical protein